ITYSPERQLLPITAHRTQILYALENYGVLILVGETGCGKSTQLPQYFYENGWADSIAGLEYREIICTQPRRIAAITLANRLAHELPSPEIVGYSVRFASSYNPGTTKIRYVTDGWLLRETTLLDPLLKHCSILIIDEAHERSLNTELLLGVVKKIRRVRPELRVVVCSATLDAEAFLEFFLKQQSSDVIPKRNDGTIISVDGRLHPVDIMYIKEPVSDYVKSTVEIAMQIHETETDDGDILCFLPTGEDIDEAVQLTENLLSAVPNMNSMSKRPRNAVCLPLYSSLPTKQQTQPFLPRSQHEMQNNTRRIIFATNMAETSVTVPNIAHVVDCGLAKMPFFDPYSGFDRLIVCPISKASAQQRTGRAGRVRSGKCYRLYSEQDFNAFEEDTAPEIQRCNLTTLIMTIKALGVNNVLSFDLMSIPSIEALSHGMESLYALGTLDDGAKLTALGEEMVYFPTDPRVSRMLLASLDMESREDTPSMIEKLIVGDVLTVAATLQVRNLFLQPRTERQWSAYDDAMADLLDRSGDHVTMVHLFDLVDHSNKLLSEDECRERFVNRVAMQRVLDVRKQLARFLSRRFGGGSHEAIRKCVCAGFFMNVAKLGNDGRYYTLRGKYAVSVSPSSVLHRYGQSSDYILFGETYDGSRGGIDVRPCSTISGLWLRQLAPHYW
ncbi:atp-dependent RNA helicase, partial [Thalassiosira pseudonana CCMP1335]